MSIDHTHAERESTSLRVVEVDPFSDQRWSSFVASHPDATVYHDPGWLAALESEYRQRGVYLICEDHLGRTVAVFPASYTRGLPFNLGGPIAARRLSSLPRTPLAGPLSTNMEGTVAILAQAIRLVGSTPGSLLQIKTAGTELDGALDGLVAIPWRLTYVLQLPGVPGGVFRIANAKYRGSIQRSINKAIRSGVIIRAATSESDLRDWYGIYLDTMRRNIVPARSLRFFQNLWRQLQPRGVLRLLLAEINTPLGRTMIGGSIFLRHKHTDSFIFGASKSTDLELRPNDYILWEAISDACRHGCTNFDFGEVPEGHSSLAQFKRKWGAEPSMLYRYYWPHSAILPHRKNLEQSTPLLTLVASKVWPRLPLIVTAWLSDMIYSYL